MQARAVCVQNLLLALALLSKRLKSLQPHLKRLTIWSYLTFLSGLVSRSPDLSHFS